MTGFGEKRIVEVIFVKNAEKFRNFKKIELLEIQVEIYIIYAAILEFACFTRALLVWQHLRISQNGDVRRRNTGKNWIGTSCAHIARLIPLFRSKRW